MRKLTRLTVKQWDELQTVNEHFLKTFPDCRKGQSLFNALSFVAPAIGEEVRGTELDPFHRDERVPELIKAIIPESV